MRVRFTDVAGTRTRYYEHIPDSPAGLPIVLVHGGGALADTFYRNIEALGQDRPVYAPDLLGHGFTDAPADLGDEPPQVRQMRHVAAFTDALALDRFILLGHSFGGLVAALLYFDRPERIARLVLVASSSVFQPADSHRAAVSGAQANQLPALEDPTPQRIRRRNIGSNYDDHDPFEELVALQMTALALPGRIEAFRWLSAGLAASADDPGSRVVDRLDQIKVPTLMIAGREDPRCRLAAVEAKIPELPLAELHVFDHCGHKPFSEHANHFNETVRTYLSSL